MCESVSCENCTVRSITVLPAPLQVKQLKMCCTDLEKQLAGALAFIEALELENKALTDDVSALRCDVQVVRTVAVNRLQALQSKFLEAGAVTGGCGLDAVFCDTAVGAIDHSVDLVRASGRKGGKPLDRLLSPSFRARFSDKELVNAR